MLIKPGGNIVIIISFLWGEGGSVVGAITIEFHSGSETSNSICSISGSASSVSEMSPVSDLVWNTYVIFGP